MKLIHLLIIVLVVTLACWAGWLLVLLKIDPTNSGNFGLALFYGSLFLAIFGTFFLCSFAFRKIFNHVAIEQMLVGTSFRQSFFFSLIIIGVLFLQSLDFLTWWNLLILILAIAGLEFVFLTSRKNTVLPPTIHQEDNDNLN